jgi:hypothetical protein
MDKKMPIATVGELGFDHVVKEFVKIGGICPLGVSNGRLPTETDKHRQSNRAYRDSVGERPGHIALRVW